MALTTGTVVHDLVRKKVAIYAEVLVAECTLIATACCGNLVTVFVHLGLFLLGWYFRKRFQACKTLPASPRICPRNSDPIYEWEEMVVRTCKMCREDKG